MKKIIGVGLGLALLAGSALAEELQNPSFEKAGESPDQAASWHRWGDWFNRETDWVPVLTGRAILAYHHWRVEKPASSGVWQDVAGAKAGRRYTFTINANVDRAKDGKNDAQTVELRLEGTVNGKQVTINSQKFDVKNLATGDSWSPLRVTGTAATDSLRVLVVVEPAAEGPRDGAIKFDDASLVKAEPPIN